MKLPKNYFQYEKKVAFFLKGKAEALFIWAYSLIYFWYGLQKVFGVSPAEELVQRATDWIFPQEFVIFLGFWEVAIGIFLLIKKWRRFGLWLLFLQFPGTFLPLFTNPEDCFSSFPFALTLDGQYIFKNLILLAGGLMMVSWLHPQEGKPHDSKDLG